jgi:hypothetical protein
MFYRNRFSNNVWKFRTIAFNNKEVTNLKYQMTELRSVFKLTLSTVLFCSVTIIMPVNSPTPLLCLSNIDESSVWVWRAVYARNTLPYDRLYTDGHHRLLFPASIYLSRIFSLREELKMWTRYAVDQPGVWIVPADGANNFLFAFSRHAHMALPWRLLHPFWNSRCITCCLFSMLTQMCVCPQYSIRVLVYPNFAAIWWALSVLAPKALFSHFSFGNRLCCINFFVIFLGSSRQLSTYYFNESFNCFFFHILSGSSLLGYYKYKLGENS